MTSQTPKVGSMKPPGIRGVAVLTLLAGSLAGCSASGDDEGESAPEDSAPSAEKIEIQPDTFYYLATDPDDEKKVNALSFNEGGEPRLLFAGDTDLGHSGNVSLDGRFISWVDTSRRSGDGRLRVWSVEEGAELEVEQPDRVDGQCQEPVWTGDGRLLVHTVADGEDTGAYLLNVETGEIAEEDVHTDCHTRIAPDSQDGSSYALLSGDLKSLKIYDGGSKIGEMSADLGDRVVVDIVSAATGPGSACVDTVAKGEPVGDVARSLYCDTIIDVPSGEIWDVDEDAVASAMWTENGDTLARLKTDDGYQLAPSMIDDPDKTIAEHESLTEADLIGYVP
ncbi:MAG: hypothetical protein ACRDXX_01665 [Stackebrandtia sp.]